MRTLLVLSAVALAALALATVVRPGPDALEGEPAEAAGGAARPLAEAPPAGPAPGRVSADVRAEPTAAREAPPDPDPRDGEASPARLFGRLVDDATGAPLPGERLELVGLAPGAAPRVVVTDATGRFEVPLAAGVTLVQHDPPPPAAGSALAPDRVLLEAPADAPLRQTFRARRAPLELSVEVVDERGTPVAEARVTLASDAPEEVAARPWATTDADGRARLAVWFPDAVTAGHLRAWHADGRVSELLPIAAPLEPFPRRLVLGPGAALEVRLSAPSGEPIAERRVVAASTAPQGPRRYGATDEQGLAVLEGLYPGPATLEVERPHGAGWTEHPVALRAGERAVLELTLDEGAAVAVSGRVLDEDGAPLAGLAVVVIPEGGGAAARPIRVLSDAQGRFTAETPPCPTLRVDANREAEGDRFEPAELRVPYGSQHVELRRTASARPVRFAVEVVDRLTGEPLPDFTATVDRGPGCEAWAETYAGRPTFELRLLDDARWRVAARDHLVRTLDLAAALAALPEGRPLRIELERGFEHDLLVIDAESGAPLAGVLLRSPTAGEARTGADGRARLVADHWPVYTVEAPGYSPATFDPNEHVRWDIGPLELERADR